MDKMMLSQKASITTEEEIIEDTTISKILNFLGAVLIMAGIILFLFVLGGNDSNVLTSRQLIKLCTSAVVLVTVGAWMELKSQRHRKHQTFAEYMADKHTYDYDDYDYLQDGDDYDA